MGERAHSTARTTGRAYIRNASSGVKVLTAAKMPLSMTGISTSRPRARSGASTANSRVTFAPSDVPPTTASLLPGCSSTLPNEDTG